MASKLKIVMFTDQVESTHNTAQRSLDEIASVTRDQKNIEVEACRLTRGTIIKDTGDGCFAEFSSVIDAVQAGVLLQNSVAERNLAQALPQLRFELHIAIDVGELLVLENGDLRGEAANRCARICSATPPGEVYLSATAAGLLKHHDAELIPANVQQLKGIHESLTIFRVLKLHHTINDERNPFIWRTGITAERDFFNRDHEQRTVRTYLRGRQSCQLVGQRRIGKSSFLLQCERLAGAWVERATPAYLSFLDPRCFTLAEWLKLTAQRWNWDFVPTSLAEFSEGVEVMIRNGRAPVLCLDEFDEASSRRYEFSSDYYKTLRSCAQHSLSIITASRRPLSELTRTDDPSSPFYNALPVVRLEPFNDEDSEDFVNLFRLGVPSFSTDERQTILSFAKGHPLALQVACFHVVEMKRRGESLTQALHRAADDMKEHSANGW